MIAIAPSILSADFSRLGEVVRETELGGANRIHVDVMDGHFVPNLSMGPIVVKGLRPATKLMLETHLMVTDPEMFLEPFLKAGSDSIIFHLEAVPNPRPMIAKLRAAGKKVGLSVKPKTPIETLEPYLKEIDLALCMTVEPGFGGQSFLEDSPTRIKILRGLIEKQNPACELEVDGGINEKTIFTAASSGANVFVAGSAVFEAKSGPRAAVGDLTKLAEGK
jgi:ribulose-phosphate 3-epimerase